MIWSKNIKKDKAMKILGTDFNDDLDTILDLANKAHSERQHLSSWPMNLKIPKALYVIARARSSALKIPTGTYIGRLVLRSLRTKEITPSAEALIKRAEALHKLNVKNSKQKSLRVTYVIGWMIKANSEDQGITASKYITALILKDTSTLSDTKA